MRMNLYDELCQIDETQKFDYLIGGDFNEVLHSKEKLGGASINNSRIDHLRNYLNNFGVVDLRYKDCKYTWTNKCYNNRNDLIFERFDRCSQNPLVNKFIKAIVSDLPKTISHHFHFLLISKAVLSIPITNPSEWKPCGVGIHLSKEL